MPAEQVKWVTTSKFHELTGLPMSTIYYYMDENIVTCSTISYGETKSRRLIDYQEFLETMERRKIPAKPRRMSRSQAEVRRLLRQKIAEAKRGSSKGHYSSKKNSIKSAVV